MRRLAALAVLLLGPAGAAAQEIAGVAVDSAGRPLPDVPVALHRVGGGSGANVAAATSDGEGRFRFAIDVPDSAVYFVAMRHGDRMYIGPPARGGITRVTNYVVRAEPGSEAGAVASALSGGGAAPITGPQGMGGTPPPAAPGGAGAVWFVAILALVAAGSFLATAPAYRRRRTRELVLELARLEDRLAAADPGADAAPARARRDALWKRLAPRA